MTAVVASAVRRALAGLVLCFGLFALLFTFMERIGSGNVHTPGGGPKIPQSVLDALTPPPTSPWEFPIAIALVILSLAVAAAIYPTRRTTGAP
ncbi:MAG: hypothetical protein QOG85_2186 [Gaiellaceae bacterium]|nr:hypothetical protein [Gaiellaceae bacterium]